MPRLITSQAIAFLLLVLAFTSLQSQAQKAVFRRLRMNKDTFMQFYPLSSDFPMSQRFDYFVFNYYKIQGNIYGLTCQAYDTLGEPLGTSINLADNTANPTPAYFDPITSSSLTLWKSVMDAAPPDENYDLEFIPKRYTNTHGASTRYISYTIGQDISKLETSNGPATPQQHEKVFTFTTLYTINPSPPAQR